MSEVGRGEEEREGERQTNELERRTRKDDFFITLNIFQ